MIDWNELITTGLLPIVNIIIGTLVGWAVKLFHDKTKIEVTEKWRKMLHDSLYNGVIIALRGIGYVPGTPLTPEQEAKVVEQAAIHSRTYNPDTINFFKIGPMSQTLQNIASRFVHPAMAELTTQGTIAVKAVTA